MKHKLEELIESLCKRDQNAVDQINGFYGPGPSIETTISLANGRAVDALGAIIVLARYIIELENKLNEK